MQIRGYGNINKLNNGRFKVELYEPDNKTSKLIGYFDSQDEADKELGKAQFNYFKDKSYLLPESIYTKGSITENSKNYFQLILHIPKTCNVKKNNKNGQVYLGVYPTIQSALNAKYDFFNANT